MQFRYKPAVACRKLAAKDPAMARLIDAVGPFALKPMFTHSVFQVLLRAIVYQQLSGRSASAIHQRLVALFGDPSAPDPAEVENLDDDALRGAGLSRAKLASLRDLAEKIQDGTIPEVTTLEGLSDEAIVACLTQVRGIGRWTVEMMLIERLGRPDVLPVGDYGIRQGYRLMMGLPDMPTPAGLKKEGERWRPYRSVAAWYLWRATDSVDWSAIHASTSLPGE